MIQRLKPWPAPPARPSPLYNADGTPNLIQMDGVGRDGDILMFNGRHMAWVRPEAVAAEKRPTQAPPIVDTKNLRDQWREGYEHMIRGAG